MKGKQQQLPQWLPVGIMVMFLLPFFILTLFIYPASDDYSFFYDAQGAGFLQFLSMGMDKLSGRYTAIAVTKALNPLYSSGFGLYRLFSIAMFIAFTHSAFLFVRTVFKQVGVTKGVTLSAIIVVIFLWVFMPNLSEHVYWYSSAYSYTIGLTLLLYWLHTIVSGANNLLTKILYIVLPVIIIGTCELALQLVLLSWGVILLHHIISKKIPSIVVTIALVFSLAAGYISLSANGNTLRAINIDMLYGGADMHSFSFSMLQSFHKSFNTLTAGFGVAFFILPTVFLLVLVTPGYKPATSITQLAWILIAIALISMPVLLFPYYWSTGLTFIPLRIINYSFVVFSLLIIPALFILIKPYVDTWLQYSYIKYILVVLLLAGIGLRSNIRYAVTDLANINTYQLQMDERYKVLKNSAGKDVVFAPLTYTPKTILHTDIDTAATHWYNRNLAKYYGVKTIKRR